MKHIHTFESFLNEGFIKQYGQPFTQEDFEALPVDAKILYRGTRFRIDKNNGSTIVAIPITGGSPVMINLNMFNQGGAITEAKEALNEDSSLALMVILQAAAVVQGLLIGQMAAGGGGDGFHPIDDLKAWWAKHKKDKAVQGIVDKLKDDPDVIAFMSLTNSAQRGKWYKLIEPKLNDEEKKYLRSITRTPFMNEDTNESYKQVPYNVKISGKYEITINGKTFNTSVAGFERENDDSDSLYLMDNDPLKAEHGSFIVKNSDMPKLQKGTVVKAMCSKHNIPATLKRIGDL
jgi:hypothetical protein